MPMLVLRHRHRPSLPTIFPWRLPPPPTNLLTRASPLPSEPTDNDKANALTAVALQWLALTKPLLRPPLLLEGVDDEANALTAVALQRLALTKPLL